MITRNYMPQGSVLVGKVPNGRGFTYFPRFFDDGKAIPKIRRSNGEKAVLVFTGVNALAYGTQIGELCEEASETQKRAPLISESRLVRELNKVILN